jgi:hypothetical protein
MDAAGPAVELCRDRLEAGFGPRPAMGEGQDESRNG